MDVSAQNAATAPKLNVVLGIADTHLADRVAGEVVRFVRGTQITVVHRMDQLRTMSNQIAPKAILLECDLLGEAPLHETIRQIAVIAPVVLLAPAEKQTEAARLVASGEADFLVRSGDFVPLAAALIERRLRWAEISEFALDPAWRDCSEDIGEVFRHEINNPLTGILGNAELLLAHRDRLLAADTQRLQTVVDLAVRLRETVRRISNAFGTQPRTLNSA